MQNYEVTGNFVTFGIGIEIRLSASQADSRSHLVKNKKKDIYEIISPVQFKKGEQIGIAPKSLSKALLDNLKEVGAKESGNDKKTKNDDITYPCIQHVSFGKYNVFDQDKNLITDKPVKKDEAEEILKKLIEEDNPDENNNEDEKTDTTKQFENEENNDS